VPIDEIKILKGHIEARDEEIIRQRELIATMLKQNEELIKAVKSLQESQDADFNPRAGSSRQEGVHNTKSNHKGKQPVNSKPHPHREVKVEAEPTRLFRKEIQAMIAQQMQIAGGGYAIPPVKNCGHPYPAVYDLEEYPKGYVILLFRTFSGEGNKDLNPEQHLAHFVTSCDNTGGNDALLLRQFSQSLVGTAFQWYYSLENNSIRTWDEMADSFRARFVMVSNKINIADLASTKPKKGESMTDFINRWRNLSIKCDRTLTEDEAVNLIMKNIDGLMGMLLGVIKVNTFKDLLKLVSNMERMSPHNVPSFMNNKPQ
jgi:Retrotransposon gag protein